ncbi:MAG: tetratricopeptide repeat protein [Firmicutes bacterium]|nr:tetratricopeptide repeat protein [Bacillota bacterium]
MAQKGRVSSTDRRNLLDSFALMGRGQFHRARASFEKQLRSQKSSDPATLLGLAAAYILDGDPSSAAAKTRLAWAAVSDDLFELVTIAAYYTRSGRQDEALFPLMRARAIASDNDDDAALIQVCSCLRILGESREALKVAREAVEIADDNPNSHSVLGDILYDMCNYQDALASYQTALDLDSRHIAAQVGAGKCFGEMGKWDEALSFFEKACSIDKRSPAANTGLAIASFRVGRKEESAKAAKRAFSHVGDDPSCAHDLGQLYLNDLDMPAKAVPLLTIDLVNNPHSPEHLNQLVTAMTRSDDGVENARALAALAHVNAELAMAVTDAVRLAASDLRRAAQQSARLVGIAQAAPDGPVYQLRIALERARPPIWRRVVVPGDLPLYFLHKVIQSVMKWDGDHMHVFRISGLDVGDLEYAEGEWDLIDELDVTVADAAMASRGKFRYVYDFGDNWMHHITVEKTFPRQDGVTYPVCTGGRRASPPDDCGGIYGYYSFLEALADPNSEAHDHAVEWFGKDFDPEAFDVDATDATLDWIRKAL